MSDWKDEDELVLTYKVIKEAQEQAFYNGVRYALQYLRDEVFGEEITKTSLWTDCFGETEKEEKNK